MPKAGGVAVFGSPERAGFGHGQRRTADSLVATLATQAGMLAMADQERRATLARLRAFLAGRPETADGEFTLPRAACCVLRAAGAVRSCAASGVPTGCGG